MSIADTTQSRSLLSIRRARAGIESDRSRPNLTSTSTWANSLRAGSSAPRDRLERLGEAETTAQRSGDQLQHVGQLVGERRLALRLRPADVEPDRQAHRDRDEQADERSTDIRPTSPATTATTATMATNSAGFIEMSATANALPRSARLPWRSRASSIADTERVPMSDTLRGLSMPSRALRHAFPGKAAEARRNSPAKTPTTAEPQPCRRRRRALAATAHDGHRARWQR